jgi:hypothetical protein
MKPSTEALSALEALKKAAERARKDALRYGTDLVYWQDGKVVKVKPKKSPARGGGVHTP